MLAPYPAIANPMAIETMPEEVTIPIELALFLAEGIHRLL